MATVYDPVEANAEESESAAAKKKARRTSVLVEWGAVYDSSDSGSTSDIAHHTAKGDAEKGEDSNMNKNSETENNNQGIGLNYLLNFWTSVFLAEKPPSVLVTEEKYQSMGGLASTLAKVDNFFRITDRESSFYREFTGGMTTFFSMAYIMVLNGVIIAGPSNTGMSINGVFFATTLSAGIFTFMMGALVNIPVALGTVCMYVACMSNLFE